MFRVRWKQSALNELASLWTAADSVLRQAITSASHRIDLELESDPTRLGESRGGADRVWFEFPLGIRFEVNVAKTTVWVLQVWAYRRRS